MRVTTQDLVGPDHNVEWGFLLQCQDLAKAMVPVPKTWLVLAWEDAPKTLQKLCNLSGGDEDWMALTTVEPEGLPYWVEKLDGANTPDVYVLNGVVIYVGSH